ncbi:flagellar biosynthetic protein FliQ, partial [Treponema pallidum]
MMTQGAVLGLIREGVFQV